MLSTLQKCKGPGPVEVCHYGLCFTGGIFQLTGDFRSRSSLSRALMNHPLLLFQRASVVPRGLHGGVGSHGPFSAFTGVCYGAVCRPQLCQIQQSYIGWCFVALGAATVTLGKHLGSSEDRRFCAWATGESEQHPQSACIFPVTTWFGERPNVQEHCYSQKQMCVQVASFFPGCLLLLMLCLTWSHFSEGMPSLENNQAHWGDGVLPATGA